MQAGEILLHSSSNDLNNVLFECVVFELDDLVLPTSVQLDSSPVIEMASLKLTFLAENHSFNNFDVCFGSLSC
jgi:hypothetical protein